jgi:hypothetical protein
MPADRRLDPLARENASNFVHHEAERGRRHIVREKESSMIDTLHDAGLTSGMCYTAGFVSIGLSVSSWFTSRNKESAGNDRADRCGIFVGEWAPTFFSLGNALTLKEK